MKFTKKQLKQIIQEETAKLEEGWWPWGKKDEPEPGPEPEADVDERGAPLDGFPSAQEDPHWGFPAIWVQWLQGSFRKGEDGEYDKEALQRLWKWGADPVHGAIWKWDNEKEGYVATGYQGQAGFGSMWAALVPENGETAKAAFKRWVYWNRKNKRDLEQHRADREEEERMNPGGDEGEEYEWRRGDMRVRRRHRAKPLYEDKITKKQLRDIIKEELKAVLDEQISPEDAAWWDKSIHGRDAGASMAAAETDPCGVPPGDDQGLWVWAECKCRGVGANREDEAYIVCMEEHGVDVRRSEL